jgi:hypothetical protein
MKKARTPAPVRLSRIRREITHLKAVLRDSGIVLPRPLADMLRTRLPRSVGPMDGGRLQFCLRQERELKALRDRTCPLIEASHTPATEFKPPHNARFCSGGLPSLGKRP